MLIICPGWAPLNHKKKIIAVKGSALDPRESHGICKDCEREIAKSEARAKETARRNALDVLGYWS